MPKLSRKLIDEIIRREQEQRTVDSEPVEVLEPDDEQERDEDDPWNGRNVDK